jgi:hypothetical protein
VSAGDLSNDPKALEIELSHIFELAHHWKALLLLDEADVYLRQRSHDHIRNSLVSVFLCQLEYYRGIMFLTTNRVSDFDDAMQSRIHLPLKYNKLSKDRRTQIWTDFLVIEEATYTTEELNQLAKHELNGRQVC